jgi:GTP pyrophosphokinase
MNTRVAAGRLPRFLRKFALRPSTASVAAGAAPLVAAHLEAFPRADARTLLRAYELAEKCHRGQMRKSGEPYITHPLAVATVLAMVGMDTDTVAAAVLHDTVEDTDLTLHEVAAGFGPGVAALVDGVTKLDGSRWGKAAAEAETYRKMLVAADDDLRVLVIKIADRLHNLRTIGGHPKVEKRQSVARQSMQLLVPLARRLGLYVFVREMEDLALAALEPRAYERIRELIDSTAAERAAEMERVANGIRQALAAEKLRARVMVRPRHLYSVRGTLGDSVDDEDRALTLRAGQAERIAVVVDGPPESCYAALGVLHGRWIPETSRFRDYIAMPQHNLYRALHTSLHVGNGISASVMIRTPEMDRIAEYGIAAQIRATAGKTGRASQEAVHRADLEWLQSILGWQRLSESSQFLADARADLGSGGIVTFTPSGEMVRLPKGATGLDFAYAIDPETGNDAAGVTVDGKLQPLAASLRDGQVVEVIPAAYPDQPEESWLSSALTAQARTHIRSAIALRRSDEAADAGREEVKVVADALGLDLFDLEIDGTALQVGRRLGYPDLDALYIAVAGDQVGADKVAGLLGGEDVADLAREDAPAG